MAYLGAAWGVKYSSSNAESNGVTQQSWEVEEFCCIDVYQAPTIRCQRHRWRRQTLSFSIQAAYSASMLM